MISKTHVTEGGTARAGKPLIELSGGEQRRLMVRVPHEVRPSRLLWGDRSCDQTPPGTTYHGLDEYSCHVETDIPPGNRVEVRLVVFSGQAILLPPELHQAGSARQSGHRQIERHLSELEEDLHTAIEQGTREVLAPVRGLTSISQSWDGDFTEIVLDVDTNKARSYGLTPAAIAQQIPIRGQIVALSGNLASMNTQYVRMYLKGHFGEDIHSLKAMLIHTPEGAELPLVSQARVEPHFTPAKIERVIKAIAIGVTLLTLTLIVIYRSTRLGLIMIVVLPLSLIGAAWSMLIFDKPSCMPSLVGILLLFGIIIKNAVLLVDFYRDFRRREGPFESALESVRVRYRPVMMTAFGTIAGMIPIALEQAVGLERLSPLADVAIGGLLVGTLLTLIFVPMYAYAFDHDRMSHEAPSK